MESQIDTLDFEIDVNLKRKKYLKQIKEEYSSYLSDEKKMLLDKLIAENKSFGNESAIIREIFHMLVNPVVSASYPDEEMHTFITEGLVEICVIDFMSKHSIFPEYTSNYTSNILFMRDRLSSLGDVESQFMLIFNGNIDQIIETTSESKEEFISDYQKAKKHETAYDLLIQKIASFAPKEDMVEEYTTSLMRLSAKKGKKEALSIIKQTMTELNPYDIENRTPEEIQDLQRKTINAIENYLNLEYSVVK